MPDKKPKLSCVTEDGVLAAVADFDERGRDAFLEHYGYRKATRFLLKVGRRSYDSKAIVGVAYGYSTGKRALRSNEFSGGTHTVGRTLERLGFKLTER